MAVWELIKAGGFAMYPLVLCSLVTWIIVIERWLAYRKLGESLNSFHLEATNTLLRKDLAALRALCDRNMRLPTARLLRVALDRLSSTDARVRSKWSEAVERARLLANQELRSMLWILGTVATASPFVGLFGTVVGILSSFQNMAKNGAGGFAVVASGISESLIATAAGIIIAVIALLAFNAFQVRWQRIVLAVKLQTEELSELLSGFEVT